MAIGHEDLEQHQVDLLENGEEFFVRAFEAIRAAEREIVLETFIWCWDEVGKALLEALAVAAGNGVSITITVDGWGTLDLPASCLDRLDALGVNFSTFDPSPDYFGIRPKFVGRMHRKLLVIDSELAFVGGINFSQDHLVTNGPASKQDYAVAVRGPIAREIRRYMLDALQNDRGFAFRRLWVKQHELPRTWHDGEDGSDILFVTRDNDEHQNDIERYYLMSIREAQREILIANAYFFPSYRMLKHMRNAVERGVRVVLILQGNPDKKYVQVAAGTLYDYLLDAGVEVFEYLERPFHGKVAVFDTEWSTVGSSNLDPLSFALNLEANLFIHNRAFGINLRQHLMALLDSCRPITRDLVPRQTGWRHLVRIIVFHVLRRFPRWLGKMPNYQQRIQPGVPSRRFMK